MINDQEHDDLDDLGVEAAFSKISRKIRGTFRKF